jgi:pimeloyl-ACP methyl ester carboxylesterase
MSHRVIQVSIGVAAALLFAIPSARASKDWRQKFDQGLKNPDSNVRTETVKDVEPDDKGGVKALLYVLSIKEGNTVDWHVRSAAIQRLSETTDEKALEELRKALQSKDPLVREGVALAMGRIAKPEWEEELAKLIEDKDAAIRRAGIRALKQYRAMKSIDPLLARWEKAAKAHDFREEFLIWDALKTIAEMEKECDYKAWADWWKESAGTYKRPSDMSEEERKAAAEAADKAATEARRKEEYTTTLREMPVTLTVAGQGEIPLLVIPDDSWKPTYLQPYLQGLEDVCRIFIVELPSITKLDQSKLKREQNMVYYPYDQLCDAFDEIRKQYVKSEKFAIMAHGFSTLVAARYLSKYGDNVSHAIFVGCFPGDENYGNLLDGLTRKATGLLKDPELKKAVDFHWVYDTKKKTKQYQPKTDAELEALERKFFSLQFANWQDPEIEEIWLRCRKASNMSIKANDAEQSLSPPFDIMREKKPNCPVLVISGAKSLWFGPKDGDRVAKNYPNGQHLIMKESAMMPWFEEPGAFQDALRAFFEKNPLKKTGAGERGKEKGKETTERGKS